MRAPCHVSYQIVLGRHKPAPEVYFYAKIFFQKAWTFDLYAPKVWSFGILHDAHCRQDFVTVLKENGELLDEKCQETGAVMVCIRYLNNNKQKRIQGQSSRGHHESATDTFAFFMQFYVTEPRILCDKCLVSFLVAISFFLLTYKILFFLENLLPWYYESFSK